jgi:hypothetical protein
MVWGHLRKLAKQGILEKGRGWVSLAKGYRTPVADFLNALRSLHNPKFFEAHAGYARHIIIDKDQPAFRSLVTKAVQFSGLHQKGAKREPNAVPSRHAAYLLPQPQGGGYLPSGSELEASILAALSALPTEPTAKELHAHLSSTENLMYGLSFLSKALTRMAKEGLIAHNEHGRFQPRRYSLPKE